MGGERLLEGERARGIHSLPELRAVRLLLHRNFLAYVSDPRVRRVLVQEGNKAVIYVLNAMVSASRTMMVELRKLEVMLTVMGVRLEALWIPSAVNRFADALSRTWDPEDMMATEAMMKSIKEQDGLDEMPFGARPLGKSLAARQKFIRPQVEEDWGDGRARLYISPVDMLPLVIRKLEQEKGCGVLLAPNWPAQPCFERFRPFDSAMVRLVPNSTELGPWEGERRINDGWGIVVGEIGGGKSGLKE